MTRDPVCGKQVDERAAPASSTHEGQRQVFCSRECKDKFDKNPAQYSQSKQHEHEPQRT